MNKRETGGCYEEMAAAYLEKEGYHIIERNYYTRQGEIDIVARDGEYLVFIEVKYRNNLKKGHPAEAVTYQKQQRIRKSARYYMYEHRISEDMPCRFDVVSILKEEIQLFKNAF
ncbi:YraN family protein [Clostridium sp. chh4-2]|uniref:YraN family protein n=1 Tax=Clostridium sp. chh4-2 TaxID=2067550 RepID=UPI000CCDF638|nr:YraN family protein [Clostridium sp. chh4-2]PNV63865.1 YraN family protein [Clostridium sp. chh4-2]